MRLAGTACPSVHRARAQPGPLAMHAGPCSSACGGYTAPRWLLGCGASLWRGGGGGAPGVPEGERAGAELEVAFCRLSGVPVESVLEGGGASQCPCGNYKPATCP